MINPTDLPSEPVARRLSVIRCGRCDRPVGRMNMAVPGAESSGLCLNCRNDEQGRVRVYTFQIVAPCGCNCHRG